MKCYHKIPKGKLKQFDEILKSSGGRYIANPEEHTNYWLVSFSYDDVNNANLHQMRWGRISSDIREINLKPSWIKIIRNFFLQFFKISI